MKKLLFSFFLTLSVSLSVVGQISLESTYPNSIRLLYHPKIVLSNGGEKMVYTDEYNFTKLDTLFLVNPNGSIHKVINLGDFDYLGIGVSGKFHSISDHLFDLDNEIELLVSRNDSTFIIDESGSIEYTFPFLIDEGVFIWKIDQDFKLLLQDITNNSKTTYTLPGTLPCDPCGSISGLVEPTGGGLGEMKVYPNPFNNTLQVNYDFPTNQINPRLVLTDILGRELKEIKLTSQSDNVSINTSDLPKGTIIVSLYGGQNMISKKVIKID